MSKMKSKLLEVALLVVLVTTSVYHPRYDKRNMANGNPYSHWKKYTAASTKYPIGTKLRVEYGTNRVDVVVTDTMSMKGRLDLSGLAMRHLVGSWCTKRGDAGCTLIKARVRVIKPANKKNK